ncbi:hypothetical protein ACH4SP_11630 [Streptomyces sp. NPDC021093]|uniref:hypothetical protein n=1 Tax=Streptomyces sp. NPDC021093 TaxID=3365112 RepID=UPI00378A74E5
MTRKGRPVVLQAVTAVTAVTVHCADTGEHPQTAFGDPDAYAVQTGAWLVPSSVDLNTPASKPPCGSTTSR